MYADCSLGILVRAVTLQDTCFLMQITGSTFATFSCAEARAQGWRRVVWILDKACHILDGYTDVGLGMILWNRVLANNHSIKSLFLLGTLPWRCSGCKPTSPSPWKSRRLPAFTTICEATVIINTVVTVTYPGTVSRDTGNGW
jgi:hypothetical protein